MNVRKAMWWLAGIWFAGAGLCFVVLIGQSQAGVFDSDVGGVWGWFLPTVMPTLSLIVGALVADYRKVPAGSREANKSAASPVFWLGAALSGLYLLLLGLAIVMPSFQVEAAPLALMQRSNFWLGPLQGLCVAALGFFFQSPSKS
jgi:hypothetical protein